MDGDDDVAGDLVLHVEHIVEIGVVAIGPDMVPPGCFDELGGDPDPVSHPAHTALEDESHAEVFGDLADAHF